MTRKIKRADPEAADPDQNNVDHVEFGDNLLFKDLCGAHDAHLLLLENALGIRVDARGNRVALRGGEDGRNRAREVLTQLYERLEKGLGISDGDVNAAMRLSAEAANGTRQGQGKKMVLSLQKRTVSPRSTAQSDYLEALGKEELVFGVGPAGTGKTYLAVANAASLLLKGEVERIILSRPALEAGERIGFLPGDMKEKVDPYLRPLYDALYDVLHSDFVDRRIATGDIEIAPLGFMRGRTLSRAAVILDEAQNASVAQLKMFLTRLGEGSRMVVTGDPSQTDLPAHETSGLFDALNLLNGVKGVKVVQFSAADVVRHALVARIVRAYDNRDKSRRKDQSEDKSHKND